MRLFACLCGMPVLLALSPLFVCAQHQRATVIVTGQVSAVVAVSAGSAARVLKGDARVSASNVEAHTLVLSLTGPGDGETHIDIPVQLRSNVGFTLSAACTTRGATLSDLLIVEAGGAGKFVYPEAATRAEVPVRFDGRQGARPRPTGGQDLSSPVTILSGPPISMSGTLDSPGNMIEVVLRVVLTTPPGEKGWLSELRVSAARRQTE